ncbi:hypothetical protein ACIOD1_12865 [Streptomyces sp. NPDC088097]|uniref:hypothetical protein n=1 Tax=Streptomyces sp. NPDC088097 TaxID=3365823 RepID=UPI003806DE8E
MSPRDPANLAARNLLAARLIERHGLDPLDAHAAVTRLHCGLPTEHEVIARQEVRAIVGELQQRLTEALAPIATAIRAFGEAITRSMAQLPPPGRSQRARPAWQSPYGPPRKGHRR